VRLKHAPDAEELKRLLADVQVLGLRSRTALTPRRAGAAPRLLAVGAYCTGTNNIDLKACAGAAWRSSTAPSPTPARWPSWSSATPSTCCAASPSARPPRGAASG
jgi:phosphoglycerate dehydrogenase-like enzyme